MNRVVKHGLIYLAALSLMWVVGSMPSVIFRPGIMGGLSPVEAVAEAVPRFDADSLVRSVPILALVAFAQRSVFRTRLKHPTIVFLGGLAVLWSAFAWFMLWFMFYSDFSS